jgi:hypothetical protein
MQHNHPYLLLELARQRQDDAIRRAGRGREELATHGRRRLGRRDR